ncbi:MAG TPA: shikimate dehydrogenase [Gemmatimonadaceae bacterium]|jgi:shikimate dehydrogenase|nr:shikimate dehydrogenase [Gemmatimonadaceae bacterium]
MLATRPERLVLLGHPVAQSLSPTFQNAALREAGLGVRYQAVDVPPHDLEAVVAELRQGGIAGNVTVPFKQRMHDCCDELTPLAGRVGAVNTFWVDNAGRLTGDNTDVGGFDAAVRANLVAEPRDLTVGVVGAGGAASAVLAAVESWPGCVAHVYNRTPERARLLCERFRTVAQAVDDIGVIEGAHLVVNATSVGLRADEVPFDLSLVGRETLVVDLVYRRGETRVVRELRARGIRAIDGMHMLVEQGALAFERWFAHALEPVRLRAVMWEAAAKG